MQGGPPAPKHDQGPASLGTQVTQGHPRPFFGVPSANRKKLTAEVVNNRNMKSYLDKRRHQPPVVVVLLLATPTYLKGCLI